MNKTSREIIREAAVKHRWSGDAFWPYPLQDSYKKGWLRLTVRFSITGNCIPGGILVFGEDDWASVNNRKKALDVIEGK